MTTRAYLGFELLRTFRNRRFLLFSLLFPVLLYFFIAAPNRHQGAGQTGLSIPLYFMVSVASFGTMTAMLSSGARIAIERAAGWTRQLRITPLTVRDYFRTKVICGYAVALTTILLLDLAGTALGVSLPAGRWLHMTALMLVGLLPFAALGILLGHLLTPDSIGPVVGGSVSLLALISGTWFPIESGFLHDVGQALPSYYLVQAGRVGIGGQPWGVQGWLVVIGWSVVLAALARRAYLRDGRRPG